MTDTVTRIRCREYGELVRVPCDAICNCPSQQYPKPSNEEGAGRAVTSAAGCTGTPMPRKRSQ